MTLKAIGFGINEKIYGLDFAHLQEGSGTDSDFADANSYTLSQGAGVREVVVGAGSATAWGVTVTNDGPMSIIIDEAITNPRTWAICIQRDWSTGTPNLVPLDCGGSAMVPPATKKSLRSGGTVDHQLIGYVTATPGSPTVAIKMERIFADKARYAEAAEAMAWDPQPGRIYLTPDRVLYGQTPSTGGVVQTIPATKRILPMTWEGIQWQQLGPAGELRLAWNNWPLPFTPFIVNAWVDHAAGTIGNTHVFPNYALRPDTTYGYFIVRSQSGAPIVGKASTGVVISRLTATVMEA